MSSRQSGAPNPSLSHSPRDSGSRADGGRDRLMPPSPAGLGHARALVRRVRGWPGPPSLGEVPTMFFGVRPPWSAADRRGHLCQLHARRPRTGSPACRVIRSRGLDGLVGPRHRPRRAVAAGTRSGNREDARHGRGLVTDVCDEPVGSSRGGARSRKARARASDVRCQGAARGVLGYPGHRSFALGWQQTDHGDRSAVTPGSHRSRSLHGSTL